MTKLNFCEENQEIKICKCLKPINKGLNAKSIIQREIQNMFSDKELKKKNFYAIKKEYKSWEENKNSSIHPNKKITGSFKEDLVVAEDKVWKANKLMPPNPFSRLVKAKGTIHEVEPVTPKSEVKFWT